MLQQLVWAHLLDCPNERRSAYSIRSNSYTSCRLIPMLYSRKHYFEYDLTIDQLMILILTSFQILSTGRSDRVLNVTDSNRSLHTGLSCWLISEIPEPLRRFNAPLFASFIYRGLSSSVSVLLLSTVVKLNFVSKMNFPQLLCPKIFPRLLSSIFRIICSWNSSIVNWNTVVIFGHEIDNTTSSWKKQIRCLFSCVWYRVSLSCVLRPHKLFVAPWIVSVFGSRTHCLVYRSATCWCHINFSLSHEPGVSPVSTVRFSDNSLPDDTMETKLIQSTLWTHTAASKEKERVRAKLKFSACRRV